jgi:hypothetical protein
MVVDRAAVHSPPSGKDELQMRNIISFAHMSLDGFMTDPREEIDFVLFGGEIADHTYPGRGRRPWESRAGVAPIDLDVALKAAVP